MSDHTVQEVAESVWLKLTARAVTPLFLVLLGFMTNKVLQEQQDTTTAVVEIKTQVAVLNQKIEGEFEIQRQKNVNFDWRLSQIEKSSGKPSTINYQLPAQ